MKKINSSCAISNIALDSKLDIEVLYLVLVNFTIKLSFKDKVSYSQTSICIRKDQIIDFINEIKNIKKDSKKIYLNDNDSKSYININKKQDDNFQLEIYLFEFEKGEKVMADIIIDKLNFTNFLRFLLGLLEEVDDIEYEKKYEQEFLKRKLIIPEL